MPKNTRTVTVTEFEVQGDHQNDKINNITFSKTCMIFNKSCKFFVFSQTSPDVKMKNSANTAGTVTESEVQGDILSEDDQINNDKSISSKARQQKTRQIVSAAAAENSDENESTLVMEEEENSESDETVVEKPTEPDSAKLQKKLGPEILNLENSSNKHAKVVGAKTSNNSEKQQSSGSINIEGKVQNPTEGVSGKFSPKSRQIAAETAEIEKQQQNNASWEDLEGEAEEANEPEPVIKFKKHVPIQKSAKSVAKTPAKSSPPKKLSKAARFAQRNKLRAISTPNKNETILEANVTFMDKSADISAIPVLSPPKRKSKKPVNEASFQ